MWEVLYYKTDMDDEPTFVTKSVNSVVDVLLGVFAVEAGSQLQHALRRHRQIVTHQIDVGHHVFLFLPTSQLQFGLNQMGNLR